MILDYYIYALPFLKKVFALIAISLSGRTALVALGQSWAATFAHTATIVFLPIVTFVITSVISDNIALSLGMVGALSIVRFRNPVRSPFELVVYFICITMGIAASVSFNWLLFFFGALILATVTLIIIQLLSKRFYSEAFFKSSFAEGNAESTLQVSATSEILFLKNSNLLISHYREGSDHQYILSSSDPKILKIIRDKTESHKAVKSYQLNV